MKRYMSFINKIKKSKFILPVLQIIGLTAVMLIVFVYYLNADLSTAPEFIYSQF